MYEGFSPFVRTGVSCRPTKQTQSDNCIHTYQVYVRTNLFMVVRHHSGIGTVKKTTNIFIGHAIDLTACV